MAYRDDQPALEARRDDLRQELAEATRKAQELESLARDRDAITRELAAVEARLAQTRARHVPLLESLRVASPCTASWEAMSGDEQVRFCGSCEKNVYNLSAMTREDAERLLAAREGSVCVRYYQRADGTVMTSDCPVGVKRKRRRRLAVAVAGAGAMAASALAWRQHVEEQRNLTMTMGAVAAMPVNHYVAQPPTAHPEPGLVLSWWRDVPGKPDSVVRWRIYADHHVERDIQTGKNMARASSGKDGTPAVSDLLADAARFQSRSVGITTDYDDSALHAGWELFGAGSARITDEDAERLNQRLMVVEAVLGERLPPAPSR
jgi:hypothetical protein